MTQDKTGRQSWGRKYAIEGKLFKHVRKTYNSAELFARITSVRKNDKTRTRVNVF